MTIVQDLYSYKTTWFPLILHLSLAHYVLYFPYSTHGRALSSKYYPFTYKCLFAFLIIPIIFGKLAHLMIFSVVNWQSIVYRNNEIMTKTACPHAVSKFTGPETSSYTTWSGLLCLFPSDIFRL